MRYLGLLLTISVIFTVLFASCSTFDSRPSLDYQEGHIFASCEFLVDGEPIKADVEIAAAEYDSEGRMLARDMSLTVVDNSIIKGVSFYLENGGFYVAAGNMKIPVKDEGAISGIRDILSLFCISEDSYYSSEKVTEEGLDCVRSVYVSGDNRAEVTLDLSCRLPTRICAVVNGRELSCDVRLIRVE